MEAKNKNERWALALADLAWVKDNAPTTTTYRMGIGGGNVALTAKRAYNAILNLAPIEESEIDELIKAMGKRAKEEKEAAEMAKEEAEKEGAG